MSVNWSYSEEAVCNYVWLTDTFPEAPIELTITVLVPGYLSRRISVMTTDILGPPHIIVTLYPDTIAGKLTRVNDCKVSINDAISAKGVNIDDTIQFDDYSKKIGLIDTAGARDSSSGIDGDYRFLMATVPVEQRVIYDYELNLPMWWYYDSSSTKQLNNLVYCHDVYPGSTSMNTCLRVTDGANPWVLPKTVTTFGVGFTNVISPRLWSHLHKAANAVVVLRRII